MSLEPLTDYSKFKVDCEKILSEYKEKNFCQTVIRPATVCGYSPRQRLDVVVNILTNLAFHNRKISIFGGNQLRPNIHINDMTELYVSLLNCNDKIINRNIFNAGYENNSVSELGNIVKNKVGDDVQIIKTETNDNRSYHISSEKIKKDLNFSPKHTIDDAVQDLLKAFKNKLLNDPLNNEFYFNIKRMNSLKLNEKLES